MLSADEKQTKSYENTAFLELKSIYKGCFLALFLLEDRKMTEIQAVQIEELRMNGKGYKAIASAVGLSRDIVRNYCKANGMEGHGNTVALNMQKRQSDVKMDGNSRIDTGRMDA